MSRFVFLNDPRCRGKEEGGKKSKTEKSDGLRVRLVESPVSRALEIVTSPSK